MAKKDDVKSDDQPSALTAFETRLTNILALWYVKGQPQAEQIHLLAAAGFRSAEIAVLLGTTRNTVSVELSRNKKKK